MKHIIALGGGGFSDVGRKSSLDAYIMAQTEKRHPKVCFIPTASGDSPTYIRRFYATYKRLGAAPSHLPLFAHLNTRRRFVDYLCDHDAIFVGGGNTRNMLILWKAWGLDAALKRAYDRGIILAGISAGALCWFESGLTDSFPGRYAPLDALGWLRGSFSPHFDSEPKRRPLFRRLIGEGKLPRGYGVDDGVALHFIDGKLHEVRSDRKHATARVIFRKRGRAFEQMLPID